MNRLREYWEDFKALRRGERRVAPHGQRGRVYGSKNTPSSPLVQATSKSMVRIDMKIIRADGTVEEI